MRNQCLSLVVSGLLLTACGDSSSPFGGSNAGGNGTGGTTADGGSNIGGSNVGGSNIGGSNIGGSNVGGSNAGGSGGASTDGGGGSAANGGSGQGGSSAGCGNAVIDAGEDCDGVLLGGADCVSEGFVGGILACTACSFDTSACSVWSCDPMFFNNDDGCDCSCGAHDPDCDLPGQSLFCNEVLTNDGTTCVNDICVPLPIQCGNGFVQAGETCDDGNIVSGDGCSSTCQNEPPPPSWTCDPMFYNALDGCDCSCGAHDPDCNVPGQTLFCDEILASAGTTCVNDICVVPPVVCGNGIIQTGEACDDGNLVSGDGCSSTCQNEPPPPSWTCNTFFYNAQDGCDCSCGAHDPDCNLPGQTLFCDEQLAPPGTTCNASDICVP